MTEINSKQPSQATQIRENREKTRKTHFFIQKPCRFKKTSYLCTRNRKTTTKDDSLAQLVEHNTFNVGVLGSNPKRITKRKAKGDNKRQVLQNQYFVGLFYCPLATLTAKKRALMRTSKTV